MKHIFRVTVHFLPNHILLLHYNTNWIGSTYCTLCYKIHTKYRVQNAELVDLKAGAADVYFSALKSCYCGVKAV